MLCLPPFKRFSDGYQLAVAEKRDKGLMKQIGGGKLPVTFSVYCSLAKLALFAQEERSKFAGFVHLSLILSWNQFVRSCSISDF
jgi:hypothetical protein